MLLGPQRDHFLRSNKTDTHAYIGQVEGGSKTKGTMRRAATKSKFIFSSAVKRVQGSGRLANETCCNSRTSMPSPRRPRDTHAPRVAIAKGADKAHAVSSTIPVQGVPRERFFSNGSTPYPRARAVRARGDKRNDGRSGNVIFFAVHEPGMRSITE